MVPFEEKHISWSSRFGCHMLERHFKEIVANWQMIAADYEKRGRMVPDIKQPVTLGDRDSGQIILTWPDDLVIMMKCGTIGTDGDTWERSEKGRDIWDGFAASLRGSRPKEPVEGPAAGEKETEALIRVVEAPVPDWPTLKKNDNTFELACFLWLNWVWEKPRADERFDHSFERKITWGTWINTLPPEEFAMGTQILKLAGVEIDSLIVHAVGARRLGDWWNQKGGKERWKRSLAAF